MRDTTAKTQWTVKVELSKMRFFERSNQVKPSRRPRTTLQKLQENLCRQLQPNMYQRKLRLQSRKIEIMPHWSRTRDKFISLTDILMKETKSKSNFLKRLHMRDHSILSGTAGLVGWFVVTKILMLTKTNAQNAVRIILKMGLTGWSVLWVKNGFMRHVFIFVIFV